MDSNDRRLDGQPNAGRSRLHGDQWPALFTAMGLGSAAQMAAKRRLISARSSQRPPIITGIEYGAAVPRVDLDELVPGCLDGYVHERVMPEAPRPRRPLAARPPGLAVGAPAP
jgi:hypothetical protein